MPKYTAPTISADRASIAKIQSAFDDLQTLLDSFLSRDGTSPNAMSADIDMNGYSLLNHTVLLKNTTTVSLADATNAVNTANKASGKAVYDTTTNRVMIASGSAAGDSWYDAVGENEVSPS